MADSKTAIYTKPQIDQLSAAISDQFKARPIKEIHDANGNVIAPDATGVVKLPTAAAGGSTTGGGLTLSASRIATR